MNYSNVIRLFTEISHAEKDIERQHFLWKVTRKTSHYLALDDLAIYLKNDKGDKLIQHTKVGLTIINDKNTIEDPFSINVGKGVVGKCALSKSFQNIKDTSLNTSYIIEDIFRYSELCVPILSNGNMIGVIDSENRVKNYYTKEDVKIFTIISNLISLQLHRLPQCKSRISQNYRNHFNSFKDLIISKKLYQQDTLSLNSVSSVLGISPSYLSQIIHKVGEHSFSYFINELRVNHVMKELKENKHKNRNLLSIGFEAGFNSKSSFYANFKRITEKSPSQYMFETYKV